MNLISDLKSSIFGVDFRFFFNSIRNSRSNNKKIIYQKLVGLKVYGVSYYMNHINRPSSIEIFHVLLNHLQYGHELKWCQHYSAITKRK